MRSVRPFRYFDANKICLPLPLIVFPQLVSQSSRLNPDDWIRHGIERGWSVEDLDPDRVALQLVDPAL